VTSSAPRDARGRSAPWTVIRDEADLEGRLRRRAALRAVQARHVRGGQLAGGQRQRGGARVELGVLAALVHEPAPLAERALVEVEACRHVGHVQDRVSEAQRAPRRHPSRNTAICGKRTLFDPIRL
jgi:hypothetical protein